MADRTADRKILKLAGQLMDKPGQIRHNRNSIVLEFGCHPTTADRWMKWLAEDIPGMSLTKDGGVTWLEYRRVRRGTSLPPRGGELDE